VHLFVHVHVHVHVCVCVCACATCVSVKFSKQNVNGVLREALSHESKSLGKLLLVQPSTPIAIKSAERFRDLFLQTSCW